MAPPSLQLSGKVFGQWAVLRKNNGRPGHGSYWDCRCLSCNGVGTILGYALTRGTSLRCRSCARAIRGISRRRCETAFRDVLRMYKNSAKSRGLDFALSNEEFKGITSKACHYCGLPPFQRWKKGWDSYTYSGIDRKDNAQGYTLGNSLPCCFDCNRAKLERTYEEYINWVMRSSAHLGGASGDTKS